MIQDVVSDLQSELGYTKEDAQNMILLWRSENLFCYGFQCSGNGRKCSS